MPPSHPPHDLVGRALADILPRPGSEEAAEPADRQDDSRDPRPEAGAGARAGAGADARAGITTGTEAGPAAGSEAGTGTEAGAVAGTGTGTGADADTDAEHPPDSQEQILGAVHLDRDLRIVSSNLTAAPFAGLSAPEGSAFAELLPPGDVPTVTQRLRTVIETGEAHVARVQRLRRSDGTDLVVSMSILPAATPDEGLAVSLIAMAKRLHLYAAATAIGTSLDIDETAHSLARALLPWGAVAAVDLDFAVWTGEAVTGGSTRDGTQLRRAALVPDRAWPDGYLTPGDNLPREAGRLLWGAAPRRDLPGTIVLRDREAIERVLGDPEALRALVPGSGPLNVACIPLVVEGPEGEGAIVLGMAEVWRRPDQPFASGELLDLRELVAKTAHHVDLARRHQREHAQVLALQRRPLPPDGGDTIEVASVSRPTTPDSAGVGGDWVNTFPLPGDRTALVVGDVVGHGLGAAAATGQLSVEARALLSAGLTPAEVLARLDETVTFLDDTDASLTSGYSALGSTCCIVVYDPVEQRCVSSSAGHMPLILVRPDGSTEIVAPRPQPSLGAAFAAREPFDVHEFAVPPGSLVALYTDGLVEDPGASIDEGIRRLADAVRRVHPWDDLHQAAHRVVTDLVPHERLRDDVTLMLARMMGRRARDTATWLLPAHDESVGRARGLTGAQLSGWRAGEQVREAATLVISELVTNAVRHGAGPITVRLIRAGQRLICEVGDDGNGRPRLHRGDLLDEGGRGLLVVHKVAVRWGVRWSGRGKVVWTELGA